MIKKVLPLLLIFIAPLFCQSDDNEITLALLEFENMQSSSDYDYLGVLFSVLIKEDLSHTKGIGLVDRAQLNKIINEQKQQLSGLMDENTTIEVGKLIGCDYLCGGSYAVMGDQILLDLSLTKVETGRVLSFSTRGNTEDMIHLAAEKLVRELLGESVIFRTAQSNTPILEQAQRDPGTLKLFSHLVDGRIYIDDEFYEYTTGNRTAATEVVLSPGKHRVMIDLGPNFGVVHEPAITFSKWEQEFVIESGKTLVLEDQSRSINSRLYDISNLARGDVDFTNGEQPVHKGVPVEFSFLDRSGEPVNGSLSISYNPGVGDVAIRATVTLTYQDEVEELSYSVNRGDNDEFIYTKGVVQLKLQLDNRYKDNYRTAWYLSRSDVYQGMHRE